MTTIEWTQETWNPILGCSKISEGCRNCYAINQAYRNWSMAQALPEDKRGRLAYYEGLTEKRGDRVEWTGKVAFVPEALEIPLKRKKPTTYFVNSMSDLFHESVADEWIDQIFAVMTLTPQHTYQVLTKRPQRMLKYFDNLNERRIKIAHNFVYPTGGFLYSEWRRSPKSACTYSILPLPNVWLGTSIENQSVWELRSEALYRLHNQGWKTFYSCEPLLEDLDLYLRHRPVDWVIAGGESGSGARECHIDWIRSLAQQCQSANVPVFVKQLGSNPTGLLRDGVFPKNEGSKTRWKLRDRKGGDIEEWPEDLQIRELPTTKTGAIAEVQA